MRFSFVVAASALAAGAKAQIASYSPGTGVNYEVNIPADTASSGSGSIYFQLTAPSSGTNWVGLGIGGQMRGALIFMMYAASDSNVTVSPRLGTGETQPQYTSSTTITLLEGTGISNGVMTANVRCDNCLSWSGGTLDVTSSSSSWIWAYHKGSAVDSTSLTENLQQHTYSDPFTLDLTTGTGGSSTNPFLSSGSSSSSSATAAGSSATGSSTSTATGTASSTSSGSTATGSSSSGSSFNGFVGSSGPDTTGRRAHGVIMGLLFILFFPLFAMTMYLPYANRVRMLHAPLQILSTLLLLVGLGLGVKMGKQIGITSGYHQVIGYLIVAVMISVQPAMGVYQHLHFRRTGTRSRLGAAHQALGRLVILLGIVNGGLGFYQTGAVGSTYVPKWAVIAYSIVAVVVFIIYVSVVVAKMVSPSADGQFAGAREKISSAHGVNYEMNPPRAGHQAAAYEQQNFSNFHASQQQQQMR